MSFSPGNSTLAGSADVNLSNPASGDALLYNGGVEKWQNNPQGTAASANIGTGSGDVMPGDDTRVANRSNLYTVHGIGPRIHQETGQPLPQPPAMYVRWISSDFPSYAVEGDEWDIIGAPAMPQLSIVGSGITAAASSATTRTVTLPSGIQDGDTVIAVGVHPGSTSYSTLAGIGGIALVTPDKVQSGHHQYVWIKENASAADSSQVLTMSSFDSGGSPLSLWTTLGVMVLRGTPLSGAIDPQNDALGDFSDTSISNPALTTSILSCEFAIASATGTTGSPSNTFSTPTGFTQIISGTSSWTGGGGQTSLWIGYASLTSSFAGASMGGHGFTFPVSVGKWARTLPIGAVWS